MTDELNRQQSQEEIATENQDQETENQETSVYDQELVANVQQKLGGVYDSETSDLIMNHLQGFCSALMRGQVVDGNVLDQISELIAEIDVKLSEQIDVILHNDKFQALESSWRGLEHFVFGTNSSEKLKIKLLNVRRDEVDEQFKKYKGKSFTDSDLFRKIFSEEYNTHGGNPYSILVGDYSVSHSRMDIELVRGFGKIAAASHCPFITSVSPKLFKLKSWTELKDYNKVSKVLEGQEYSSWKSLRESEDSKYVCFTAPRFLSRLPYGRDNPVKSFSYTEEAHGDSHDNYLWSSSSYLMATNITQSYDATGWCQKIIGIDNGGQATGLNIHTYEGKTGQLESKCPTEIAINYSMEEDFSKIGINVLCHNKSGDDAAFLSGKTFYEPVEYDDPVATANSRLNSGLPYILTVSRFSHILREMVVRAIGSFKEEEEMNGWLDKWVKNYVTADEYPSDEEKAKKPLKEGQVSVKAIPGSPGSYYADFELRPHYLLEKVEASMRLVSEITQN